MLSAVFPSPAPPSLKVNCHLKECDSKRQRGTMRLPSSGSRANTPSMLFRRESDFDDYDAKVFVTASKCERRYERWCAVCITPSQPGWTTKVFLSRTQTVAYHAGCFGPEAPVSCNMQSQSSCILQLTKTSSSKRPALYFNLRTYVSCCVQKRTYLLFILDVQ